MHHLIARRGLAAWTVLAISSFLFAGSSAPQVKTRLGTVEGKDDGKVKTFLGIPFAAPPVGDLRWKAPAPAAKWSGVKKTTEFGSHCLQGNVFGDMVFHDPGGSEDCLTLNVWVADKHVDPKLPVMVWIYGGGFVAGTTSETRHGGVDELPPRGLRFPGTSRTRGRIRP
jgi:para-nitrobenzyl esterase